MRFTIEIRCHITKTEHIYFVIFPSERAVKRFFRGKKDKLLSVEEGWDAMLFMNFNPFVPSYQQLKEIQKPYEPGDDADFL
jgi:hypothetical protein